MNIRVRLSLQFVLIVATLITLSLLLIYYFSSEYRAKDFYTRLKNKAVTTAKLLVQVDAIDNDLMRIIDRNEKTILSNKNIAIYDYQNKVVYAFDPAHPVKISREILDNIRQEKEVEYFDGEYQVYGMLFFDKHIPFVVVASAVDEMGYDKINNLRKILLAVFACNILVVSILGYVFSGRALAPISEVVKEVDKISASNLGNRVNEGNGKDEIAVLARTFNNMLDRIEEAFDKQKAFVANASHELRNPLTAISGQIEVTLLKKRSPEEYENTLRSIFEDIRKLSVLSNRLLSLANLSAESSDFNFSAVRVDELLWQAREEVLFSNPAYGVNIEFPKDEMEENQLIISGNDTLLKIAFLNVMDNGCKFSSDGQVTAKVQHQNDQLRVDFIDKGVWIRPEEQTNIFEPFYRSKSTGVKGHGIGLSLVQKIIHLHQGSIQITSDPSLTIFSISLPIRTV